MKRRLLNVLTAASLLTAAALVAGWWRGHDQFFFTIGDSLCSLSCGDGSVFADVTVHWPQRVSRIRET